MNEKNEVYKFTAYVLLPVPYENKVDKKGDLSDFYFCPKCKKAIVGSTISKYKNK